MVYGIEYHQYCTYHSKNIENMSNIDNTATNITLDSSKSDTTAAYTWYQPIFKTLAFSSQ